MIKAHFIAEAGKVDSQGDIINLDGLKHDETVLLTKDFDAVNPLGRCKVFKEHGLLKAEAEIPEEYLNSHPAIGFQVLKSHKNEHGGMTVTEAKLFTVSLCSSQNTDPSIKSIAEQINGNS